MSIPFFIIISGPTGVGKTALVDELAQTLPFPIEVINADMGQLYEPLTIGTAKPDLTAITRSASYVRYSQGAGRFYRIPI